MRIGLLTTSFPRHADDIAGHFVLGFAQALTDRGHTVEVLAPEPAEPWPVPVLPNLSVRWVPYLRPRDLERTFYGAGVPDNLRSDPRAWLGLGPFVAALTLATRRRSPHWDALCSHWALPCGLIAASIARHKPHLAVLHSADLHLLAALPGRSALAAHLVAGASALSFVSEGQRTRFLDWLPATTVEKAAPRCHVQAMGVEVQAGPNVEREVLRARLGLNRFSVLSLSRLLPIKGLDVAIQACAGEPDLELIVAGEGPERPRLEALARRLNAPVRFLGLCTGARKAELLRAVDGFVCSSRKLSTGRTEGMPTALLEAQAAALPTVASDVGGIAEHLAASALLVAADDAAALRAALRRLRDEPALRQRLGAAALRVGQAHEWPRIAPRLEAWLTTPRPGVAHDTTMARARAT
jgi:glycosyltransferase involved in cell wall biosynthesis